MTNIIAAIAGLLMDLIYKVFLLKIDWGFAYTKNPILCFLGGFSLVMIPIGILNNISQTTHLLFIGTFLFFTLLIFLFYYDSPAKKP